MRSVIIERSAAPNEPITESLVVTCCAPPANNIDSDLYAGKSGASDIQAHLVPLEAWNITDTLRMSNS